MFFPKPHLIVNKKRGRTKGPSCDCALGICNEFGLYRRRTASINQNLGIEPGFGQSRHEDGGVIEFFVRDPHVVEHRLDVPNLSKDPIRSLQQREVDVGPTLNIQTSRGA